MGPFDERDRYTVGLFAKGLYCAAFGRKGIETFDERTILWGFLKGYTVRLFDKKAILWGFLTKGLYCGSF